MRRVSSLKGTGVLTVEKRLLGPVRFDLTTYEQPASCSGTITADPEVIAKAFKRSATIIRHDTGFEMRIVVASVGPAGTATVHVDGPTSA